MAKGTNNSQYAGNSGLGKVAGFFLIAALSLACDAQRTNPLDPLGQSGGRVVVSGRATTFYEPFTPLSGVRVNILPGAATTITNDDGFFSAILEREGDYTIVVEDESYAADSQVVFVTPGSPQQVTIRVDALPSLVEAKVFSSHISRWWPEQDLFRLTLEARFSDPDGLSDVDSSWIEVADQIFPMNPTQSVGSFSVMIDQAELLSRSLDDILGQLIKVGVKDRAGFSVRRSTISLARVIHTTPVAASPINLETALGPPVFRWVQPIVPFDHSFSLDVVRVEANIETITDTIVDIPSGSTSVAGPALSPGTYYWVIWIEDQFGNRSRSKQAGFVVQ